MGAFFLASNGLLYRNPLIEGPGWFLVFDGEDDPELVVEVGTGTDALDATQARLRAVSILEQCGLDAVLSGPPRLMTRAYDPDGRKNRDSYCFWLDVGAPIPAALLEGKAGVREPDGDALVMSYGREWGEKAAS